jgi:hypothetical protein
LIAPTWVLAREPQHQLAQRPNCPRPARAALGIRPPPPYQLAVPAQQRRRCHHEPVTTPAREQSRKRRDERTVGGAKPRSLLLTSQNGELVPQQHQLHVFGELGSPTADEQPQDSSEGNVGEGKEHRAILPDQAAPSRLTALARISRFWYSRARVKLSIRTRARTPGRPNAQAETKPAHERAQKAAESTLEPVSEFGTLQPPHGSSGRLRWPSGCSCPRCIRRKVLRYVSTSY